jgi:hypothetical protein
MLAGSRRATVPPCGPLLQLGWRPTNVPRPASPTGMINIANAFILLLAVGAAWLGAAALVQKRTVRRRKEEQRSSNAAS